MNDYPLDEHGVCAACRAGQTHFDASYSFGPYEGSLRKLIHAFKYGKVETLAGPFGRSLSRSLPLEERIDLIVPMPMHWRKKWQRGFNQAELLAAPVAKKLRIPVVHNLKRVRHADAQAGLSRTERQKNLKNAFAVRKPQVLAGKRVLLVDDVFTTGATVSAAAAALKRAGASRVVALTLARVDARLAAP